jgi:ubiquitin-protein ligase E3 C
LKHENRRWRDDHVGERPPGSLKGVVRVNFVNEHGVEEAGVDGGGLFKDFLSALIEEAFDPKVGLFVETPDRTLYPNPASWKHAGADHLRKLEFLGAMLGKAVYEGILVDLPLAGFFLAKLRDGRPPELNDLATLDPELYHHLLSLKRLPARDVEDLFLHFTASDPDGVGGDVDLIPGGSEIRVDGENRGRYVHLLAHHLMHARIRRQSKAFVDGFRGLIEPSWLRVFAPAELRLLISGAGGKIDIDDLARSATYSGGYTADHPTVTALWDALRECREEDQRAFLKFVTACPNTPLLGFSQLMPPFCVHRSGMSSGSRASEDTADLARLPTAATCMNLLKLPPYKTKDAVKEKLLYAVTSGSGFDLS